MCDFILFWPLMNNVKQKERNEILCHDETEINLLNAFLCLQSHLCMKQ